MGFQNGIMVAVGIDLRGIHPASNQLGTDGFLLIGNSAGRAQGALPTSSDGSITITGGNGTLNLTTTSATVIWSNIGASQALVNNRGYICGSGGAISLSLPASAAVGTIIEVALSGSTSWTITQGAGQQIRLGNTQTTAGVGGSLASTAQGDWVQLVCDTSGTHWTGNVKQGNITVV